jgi:hypothetical protein
MEWLKLEGLEEVGNLQEILVNPKHITHFEIYYPESDREIRVVIFLTNQKRIVIKGEPHASYILWHLITPTWKKMIYKFHNWYLKQLEEAREICRYILRKFRIKKKM